MTSAAAAVATALRARIAIDDAAFDRLYPDHVARLSGLHWTPVSVALRATALLAPEPGMRVLDVGAGPGKLCCVGAAARAGTWRGIERDPALVAIAVETARLLEVDHKIRFDAGDALAVDWRGFDSVYLYNPFESQLFGGSFARTAAGAALADQVERTRARLDELAPGTRVVTFHGFGGDMPPGFTRVAIEATESPTTIPGGELALWIKRA
ncbi:MAG: methyltransferase domain-containing protein [Deltaproteobacteria bacterium]|nr:MAG: methyltransferase domain-containing protein [Deltaproteobacteria bacterium]TMQ14955.1 MAG: methyltransferase domain-containing protein [Deltaproteobacteria bacterium]